ncbi:hypothetical protein G6F70_008134 [Rhizopus microsporus]|nr:hypothetical protein G6F71_007605 [Rhizopus microsporus]KAG1195567.1 hypothetical protein G6F70_008134 [Rhizopus microsporus]KAG1208022.1 hypothetical protein G6F69_007572 [Rhizopus microsporus]KAG1228147.1 hypothetical protein G6F67_008010 [Rhizopus microsporus]KAG1260118.1 hypothetical protein G6F68_007663 [Rhizopus microsporus]
MLPVIIQTSSMETYPIPFYVPEKKDQEYKRCSMTLSLYSAEESEEESIATDDGSKEDDFIGFSVLKAGVLQTTDQPAQPTCKITVYSPQLNQDVWEPLSSSSSQYTPVSFPDHNKSMEPLSPQSSSRLLNAFQKLYQTPFRQPAVAPLDSVKPVTTRSVSLTERIKSKFQSKKKSSMTRSGSFSSVVPKRWPKKEASLEIKWSISSHRMYKKQTVEKNRQTPVESNTKKKTVRFTKLVSIQETFSKVDYDRGSDPDAVCMKLTPLMAQIIKEELNAYKMHEMQVHEQIL